MSPARRNQPDGPGPDGFGAADQAMPADAGNTMLLALIDRLAGMLDRSELTELEIQVGETAVVLRKHVAVAAVPVQAPAPVVAAGAAPGAEVAPSGSAVSRPSVKAPLTGIWYGSPSPGTAAYVTPGGEVAAGQVIGLIEAMKLFNEIKSDLSGRVVKVHAEDGKLVKAKQPLIEVDPL
ncbi:MAG: biotin/lipoyl-containing protein [Chloroflexota bacterium]